MNKNTYINLRVKMRTGIALILVLMTLRLNAQKSKGQVLQVNATALSDGILLNWQARTFTGSYIVFKRSSMGYTGWGTQIASLPSTATSYKDASVTPGKSFEYFIIQTSGSNALSYGFIYAGNTLKETLYKGEIVLMIDSNYVKPLANEIGILKNDLITEGWGVSTMYAGRKQTPASVKANLLLHLAARKRPATTIMILGHVPVPYSGGFTGDGSNWFPPDGHVEGSGNHTGAWPADGYYGDINFTWTDTDITMTTGGDPRNHNIPGDGKFDPTFFPSTVELEVGRVDLFNMPAFGVSDTVLVKNYLNRNHSWRTGQTATVERGLVDDNFGGYTIACTGYANFGSFFPIDSVFDNRDYMPELAAKPYLWSFGCGGGSYTTCGGVGTTSDFVSTPRQNIFTMMAGSFFGDWDVTNSFLRAPLANTALASAWGGIPRFYLHTMAMGKHLGFGTRVSQNNYGNLVYPTPSFNYSDSLIHIALMGDPTLCNRHLPPTNGLIAVSAAKKVNLKWNASKGTFDGYAVYNVDTATNVYTRVNKFVIKDTFYTDSFNYVSGNYRYEVRTIKKETTGSGTYYNVGAGTYADVAHVNSVSKLNTQRLNFYPNPTKGLVNFNESGLHNFEVYDMMGRMYDVIQPGEGMVIDLSLFPDGNYLIRCLNAQNQEVSVPVIKTGN